MTLTTSWDEAPKAALSKQSDSEANVAHGVPPTVCTSCFMYMKPPQSGLKKLNETQTQTYLLTNSQLSHKTSLA